MKLTILLMTVALFQVHATGVAQNVTFSGKNISLKTAFAEIEKQTGYVVFGKEDLFQIAKPVTLSVQNMPVPEVLKLIMKDQPLNYRINSRTIFLSPKALAETGSINSLNTRDSLPEVARVRGLIVGENLQPVAAASVLVKGKKRGVQAGHNGRFTIEANQGDVLVISSIGYMVKEVLVGTGEELGAIQLVLSESKLDDVQIIGYGQTTRRLNTGSVATITAKDIERQPVGNILLALQNRVSGMQVSQLSGVPGSAPDVQIRGVNSLAAGSSPLFILDGVPVPEKMNSLVIGPLGNSEISQLLSINPAEIERIDVLKDADATAIYGSRGANGVVLITTKKGGKESLKVSVNANTGFQQVPHFVTMMDVHQYNAMRREAMANDGIVPTPQNAPDLFTWDSTQVHDWQREFIGGTAVNQDLNLSLSAGNRNTRFYVNAGYHREGSVTPKTSDFVRKSFRANMNHTSTDRRFTMAVTSFYGVNDLNLPTSTMASYINLPPHYPLYNDEGMPNFAGPRGFPIDRLLQTYSAPSQTFGGNLKLSYEVLNNLRLGLSAGINRSATNQSYKQPLSSLDPSRNTSGTLRVGNNNNNTWIIEPQAEYSVKYGFHSVKLMAGGTFQRVNADQVSITGTNFLDDALLNNISAAGTQTLSSSSSIYSYASAFGRITYDYDQKYLMNMSFRRDGSSRFGPGNRFGNFGALGVAWVFTKEPAVQKALPFLSFGKLRSSYGISGNDQIADYGYLSTYSNITSPTLMYTGLTMRATRLANPYYRWEETRKFEAALELGFAKDRVILSTAFYQNRSGNQLISYSLSPQAGFTNYQANFPAVVQNRGIEVDITSRILTRGALKWTTTLTVSKTNNTLLKYDNIEHSSYYSLYIVGKSLNLLQAYTYQGLNADGVPVLLDKDGSGSINWSDVTPYSNNNPLFGGLSNTFDWKGLHLSFFAQFTRVSGFNNLISASYVGGIGINETVYALNRWQKPGDEKITNIPRFTTRSSTYSTRNFGQADFWMETRNVLRISNVSLSYDLPAKLLKKIGMSSCQVYMNGQNLYVFDRHKDLRLDPFTSNSTLPPLRSIVFGINSSF